MNELHDEHIYGNVLGVNNVRSPEMSESITLEGSELIEVLSLIAATDIDVAEELAWRAGLDPKIFAENVR